MGVHKFALIMSVVCIVGSLILVFFKGLNFGIDFAGGILIEIEIAQTTDVSLVRSLVSEEIKDVQIQNIDQKNFLIRVPKSNEEQSIIVKKIQEILSKKFSQIEYRKIDYVGPQAGSDLIKNGLFALFLSFLFILIYIWIRFDWQFGLGGIFALIHDVILTLGFCSITSIEFDLTSIAAILTIIGYSINDSVVIYDRIRENIYLHKNTNLSDLINSSMNSALSRTILTSGITLISILALIIFGGETLKSFSYTTFVGILIGTYSSIYISAPILLYFDPRKNRLKNIQ
jgi:preprotein translocase subunit SecF